MKKLLKLIEQLTPRKDLLEHFYWGNVYMIIGFIFTFLIKLKYPDIVWIENLFLILPILGGFLKELYDYSDYGGFSYLDWLFTSLPPFVFLIVFHFLNT